MLKKVLNKTNGIIVVNKPQNWTSHDCVAVMRRATGIKRIGHTGTLDPMATGVLPICIGTATRIMEYLDLDWKTYRATLKLGIETDTEDIWGEVISSQSVDGISKEQIEEVVNSFKGEIKQIPPKYSALKVNGKKLYEYARAGQDVKIKSRMVTVKDIVINNIHDDCVDFTVTCSKGTYIRTICSDIGKKLGCGAAMSSLVRLQSGIFKLDDAMDIESLRNMPKDEILNRLIDTDVPLVHFGKIQLDGKKAKDFVNGKKLREKEIDIVGESKHQNMYNIYYNNEFLGVAKIENGVLKAHKVFNVRMQDESI